MAILYSSWKFGIFFPVLVFRTKKNLATLPETRHAKKIALDIEFYLIDLSQF
jgi:hypothetical protein